MPEFESSRLPRGPGDQYMDAIEEAGASVPAEVHEHPLDSDEVVSEHRKLLTWFYYEREKQAANRLEMAMDADFYDNEQWTPEDAAAVRSRGQVPLVFNEVAPMVDWLIGTERRTRVDWKVLPRTEDDVELADVKTKVLKYIGDMNRAAFVRSRAFADSVKVGIGWIDDGACDDPTKDILYSKYEDWRCVLWDSAAYDLDLSDARYIFRWRWVDEDVAMAMFPDRREQIRIAVEDRLSGDIEDDDEHRDQASFYDEPSGVLYASGAGGIIDAKRRRVKLIECQYRKPVSVQMVADGSFKGSFFSQADAALCHAVAQEGAAIIDRISMRTHVAVFTERDMLSLGPSTYRHNRYSLTPIWCYRRGRDRLPYGAIRRVRDIQRDLNKRASKALFLISTNQIIYDKGAFDDINVAREEADMPDGMIEKAPGKDVAIRRDSEQAASQLQMMTLDAQTIQRSAGVNNENLGRQTNAVSGEAIKARQLQGSVATTEIFDNLRFAVQTQGEKQLSLSEQFYTEEKVVRLTGSRGRIEWVRVNQPEVQSDGSVRYINDVSASSADFVVSEADYAGTMRQVMLDGISQLAQRLPPEIAVRLFIIGMSFTDFPNKDELVEEMRRAIGERDPDKDPTPEEAQQMQAQAQQQSEALEMQRQQAVLAMEEQRAKVQKLNAEAAAIMAKVQQASDPDVVAKYEQAMRQVQEQAAQKLESMAEQLRQAQMEAANKTMAISSDADTKIEVARIQAASNERIAEIQAINNTQLEALANRLDELAAKQQEMPAQSPAQAAAPQVTVPITIESGAFQIDAKQQAGNKTITLSAGDKTVTGKITAGGDSERQGEA